MLKLVNVSKTYGDKTIKAVDNISLEVKPGEIFGFMGPNGAGKTTTIKMIVGLLKPDDGKIFVNGIDNQKEVREAKKKFSYVPDTPVLFEKIKAIEYLKFMADVYEVSEQQREQAFDEYIDLFNIKKAINDPIGSFSHGMKQKLALVGALLHDPEILILDEPMVGLDPKSAFELKRIMRERCDKGKSVFFSTHVLEVAEKLCDRIAIIKNGKIIEVGSMEELQQKAGSQETLEQIFLELTES